MEITENTSKSKSNIPALEIERSILFIREEKVMFDSNLATLYEVETKVLIQVVKRNITRFPSDFMFQLSKEEYDYLKLQTVPSGEEVLRSQIVTLENGRGKHRKYLPYVFTELGVAMLSSILRSERAGKCGDHEDIRPFAADDSIQ